jgi:hypothetical protein
MKRIKKIRIKDKEFKRKVRQQQGKRQSKPTHWVSNPPTSWKESNNIVCKQPPHIKAELK